MDLENEVTYTLKSIQINPSKKLNIVKPTKGKRVTEKEYNKIGKEMYLKRKEGM